MFSAPNDYSGTAGKVGRQRHFSKVAQYQLLLKRHLFNPCSAQGRKQWHKFQDFAPGGPFVIAYITNDLGLDFDLIPQMKISMQSLYCMCKK